MRIDDRVWLLKPLSVDAIPVIIVSSGKAHTVRMGKVRTVFCMEIS